MAASAASGRAKCSSSAIFPVMGTGSVLAAFNVSLTPESIPALAISPIPRSKKSRRVILLFGLTVVIWVSLRAARMPEILYQFVSLPGELIKRGSWKSTVEIRDVASVRSPFAFSGDFECKGVAPADGTTRPTQRVMPQRILSEIHAHCSRETTAFGSGGHLSFKSMNVPTVATQGRTCRIFGSAVIAEDNLFNFCGAHFVSSRTVPAKLGEGLGRYGVTQRLHKPCTFRSPFPAILSVMGSGC
jgi:hypothetical protein